MKIGIQVGSLGQRCGIYTYASRLQYYLNKIKNIESKLFVSRLREDVDIISIQYESGLLPQNQLAYLLEEFKFKPVIVTAHNILGLPGFYSLIDGMILHSKDQVLEVGEPWDYIIVPHPALVFKKLDKNKIRKELNLPLDKKIIGTAGFIVGTGKELPLIVKEMIQKLKSDEFLYLTTSFWKGGDFGHKKQILDLVKKYGKEDNFRIDTDFVEDEEFNKRLQACDLLFAWNNLNMVGSQSGVAADMYGSYTKLIVRDSPHYSFIGSQDKVLKGNPRGDLFVDDVLNALRNSDLKDIQDPKWLSWDNQVKKYLEYFEEFLDNE